MDSIGVFFLLFSLNIFIDEIFIYDGKNKSLTKIKDNAFIGCNSNLIAPVTIEKNAFIAAGSTITKDVEKDAMGIARAKQVNKEGYSKVLKEKRLKEFEKRNK